MRAALVLSLVVLASAPARAEAPLETAATVATGLTGQAQPDPFEIEESGRMTIAVAHQYALSEVVARVGYLLSYWKKRFDISSEWRGNRVFLSGKVYGIRVQAMFEVSATSVSGFAKDPGWPWRGQVSTYVDRKLKKYLHPTFDEP